MTSTCEHYAAEASRAAEMRRIDDEKWSKGFTRRRFLQGLGLVGAASLGSQLVTTRAAYAAAEDPLTLNTMIVVFLRGAADGLRMLVPASAQLGLSDLQSARPTLVPSTADLLPACDSGWGLHPGFRSIAPLLGTNELAFIPATSIPGLPHSHFAAQALIEAGGSADSTTGWLDRVLGQLGPGTTFRSMTEGGASPAALAGPEANLAIQSLSNFALSWSEGGVDLNESVIAALYRGFDGNLTQDVPNAINASRLIGPFAGTIPQNGAVYPAGNFAGSLQDFARILHADVGLQVGTIDVGGWDTHTSEISELDPLISSLSDSLAAFFQDLGPERRSRITVTIITEFGRHVAQNYNGGTDHGRGGLMMVLGGGIKSAGVFGKWNGLAPGQLDAGDVPFLNSAFDVYGEIAKSRLNVGNLTAVFPDQAVSSLGIMQST